MERDPSGTFAELSVLRIVQQDFASLQAYLASYSLEPGLGSKAREDLLKRAHKNALAALQIWAVMEEQGKKATFGLCEVHVPNSSAQFAQLSESFSDLTSALFASFHGLYKPAHMSLRSSIETFVRGVAGSSCPEAGTTTNVYRLFELAAQQAPFKNFGVSPLAVLNQQYAELCLFTHSATPAHLARSFALAAYPRHDTAQFREVVRRAGSIVTCVVTVLVAANKSLYLDAPSRAQDLLDEVVPAPVRLFALGAQ